MKKISIILAIIITILSCQQKSKTDLATGNWRCYFETENGEIPFIFNVKNIDNKPIVYLTNGNNNFELSGNIKIERDSIWIPIEIYDAQLIAKVNGREISGILHKNYLADGAGNNIRFVGKLTDEPRFAKVENPTSFSPSGKWDLQFIDKEVEINNNIGLFEMKDGNIVTGTVIQKSGDLRYLEGALTQNGFELSSFAGLTPYLLKFNFINNDSIVGDFITPTSIIYIKGRRNPEAQLQNAYTLTRMKEGEKTLNFSLPNLHGDTISLNDDKYKGKVVLVTILGSWCPNCLDEMEFLAPWYMKNKDKGVEIIGIAFERKDDPEYANQVLSKLKERYGIQYEILLGGKIGRKSIDKVLPQLEGLASYPTMIYIGKDGNVKKIHTGFNGPATGEYYQQFKQDFDATISPMLVE